MTSTIAFYFRILFQWKKILANRKKRKQKEKKIKKIKNNQKYLKSNSVSEMLSFQPTGGDLNTRTTGGTATTRAPFD